MCGRKYEDGHSCRETPVPFPNTEVKPTASGALVSEQRRNTDVVFFIFFNHRNVFITSFVAFAMAGLEDHRETRKQLYDYFDKVFPKSDRPREGALHYVMTNHGGKLSRPLMVFQVARAYGSKLDIFPHATAVEIVHRMSLMLDDTPDQDNAQLRQGAPACWVYCAKTYGNGTEEEKVKAGVALTAMVANVMTGTYAPKLIRESDASPEQKDYIQKIIQDVAPELVDGQCRDLGIVAPGKSRRMNVREHTKMYEMKTGALYAASAQIGGKLGNASEEDLERLGIFGRAFGTAYQLIDDYRDLHSTETVEGKPVGLDKINGRPNLASRLTDQSFRDKVARLRRRAIDELRGCAAASERIGEIISLVERVTTVPR